MSKDKDINDILREEGEDAARDYHDSAEPFDESNPKFQNPKDDDTKQEQRKTLASARASTIKMASIKWIWPNRFAEGKLAIIAGLPDEGKGQLAYMAAQITCGGSWPREEGHAPQGSVILLSAEDDPGDTIVPRLAAAGADLDRVEIVKMVGHGGGTRMFSLVTDLDLLRQKVKEVGDVRMIQIDPLSAYLGHGKMDSFRVTDVRAVLGPVCELAAELKVAIVGVMHFNKKMDITNALLRISDSLAFGAAARHVYAVINDANNNRKLFVRAKNNLAAGDKEKTLAFRFGVNKVGDDPETREPIYAPYILWEPHYVDVTAIEAMQAATQSKSPTALDDAKKFLRDVLVNGPVPSNEILEEAEANGISRGTLRRAKDDLKIKAKKDGVRGPWIWHPPEQPTRKEDAA
jgi:putative DNA primase/helicase